MSEEQLEYIVKSGALSSVTTSPHVDSRPLSTSTPSAKDVEVVSVPMRANPRDLPVKVKPKDAIKKAELYAKRQLYKRMRKLEELANGIYMVRPTKKGDPPTELVMRSVEVGEEG